MKHWIIALLYGFATLVICTNQAAAGENDEKYRQWQLNRIYHPSPKQLEAEANGKIFS